MEFDFNQEKNDLLFKKRGVTFYDVIESIAEKGILLNFDHPNQQKYPGQKILAVYPSRRFRYLIGGNNDE